MKNSDFEMGAGVLVIVAFLIFRTHISDFPGMLFYREAIRLSLNHGKSFIEAEPDTNLSDLGIVNGDILTLITTPEQPVDVIYKSVTEQRDATVVQSEPMETQKVMEKVPSPEETSFVVSKLDEVCQMC